MDARDRFLRPDNFIPPRQINPDISARTERAILWAMSLHPDERPDSIEIFKQSLATDRLTLARMTPGANSPWNFLNYPLEQSLIAITLGLTLVSLLITLLR